MRHLILKLVSSILALVALSLVAWGQVSSSSALSGAVTDPTGAVIVGATVTVKNNATSAEFKAVTTGNGTFTVPALDAGTYTVTVTAAGFKQAIASNVKIDAGTPASVRIGLEVGQTSETVTVEGAGDVIQTQSATISTTLVGRQLSDLPMYTRNTLDLLVQIPGATTTGTPRNTTFNGLPRNTINLTIDGLNTQDNFNKTSDGFFSYIRATPDAIEEVSVSTSTPGADNSGQGAVQIKMVTRQGNNDLHGSLYETHRNPSLNANYWFNNRDIVPSAGVDPATFKAPRSRILENDFGGRLGGPIELPKKLFGPFGFHGQNKAFFFVNYEEDRQPTQISRQRTILAQQAQTGIFKYGTSGSVNLLTLAGGKGFASTIDPLIGKLLTDIRNSTNGTGSISSLTDPNIQQFTFINGDNDTSKSLTTRFDFNLTSKHHLENIYNYQKYNTTDDILNNSDPAFPGFPNFGTQLSNRFTDSIALRSTLTSTLVNEARFGLTGGTVLFNPNINAGNFTGPLANQAGLNIGISTALGITNAARRSDSSRRNAPIWSFTDTLTWTRGAHNITFGGSLTQVNLFSVSQNAVPSVTLGVDTNDPANSLFTTTNFPGASNTDLTNARNLYAVLTGRITAITANALLDEKTGQYVYLGPNVQRAREREFGFFGQDSWRLKPNLTLNYGLRWEIQGAFVPLNNNFTTVSLDSLWGVSGPGNLFKPGVQTGSPTLFTQYKQGDPGYNTDYRNFSPSFGFAWSPNIKNTWVKRVLGENGQTVVRGGYSLAYVRNGIGDFTAIFGNNPGSFVTATRSLALGNLVTNVGTDTLPVLLSQTNRLGPAAFPTSPTYPLQGAVTNSASIIEPGLKIPYVETWSFGVQREITKNMAFEVRYAGNRALHGWGAFNINELNVVENGFRDEFKLAQANLQANISAGRGATFKYAGPNTGTSPLPIILANFSGLPASQANDTTKYTSTNFSSSTFVSLLALQSPSPNTFATNLVNQAAFRANALTAGLPANFFVANPGLLGGASFTSNTGYNRYDSGVVELTRRLSKGLLLHGSYTYAKGYTSERFSLRQLRVKGLTALNRHTFKADWVYELPFGHGKSLFSDSGRVMERLVGGWEFRGTMRLQSGIPLDFGNVNLVGMTHQQLQDAFKLRFDDTNKKIFFLPQDIIDNTVKAFNVSATDPSGYANGNKPTGRYLAPANGPTCAQVVTGDCAITDLIVAGNWFTRFDLSAVKKVKITERANFELRAEFLNAFNSPNFNIGSTNFTNFSSLNWGQVTSAFRDTSNSNDPGGRVIQIVARINF